MVKMMILSAMVALSVLGSAPSPIDLPDTRVQVRKIHRMLNGMLRELSALPSATIARKNEFPGHYSFDHDGYWYEVDCVTDDKRDLAVALYFFERERPTSDGIEFAVSPESGRLDSVWTEGKWYHFHSGSGRNELSVTDQQKIRLRYTHVINVVLQQLQDPY